MCHQLLQYFLLQSQFLIIFCLIKLCSKVIIVLVNACTRGKQREGEVCLKLIPRVTPLTAGELKV